MKSFLNIAKMAGYTGYKGYNSGKALWNKVLQTVMLLKKIRLQQVTTGYRYYPYYLCNLCNLHEIKKVTNFGIAQTLDLSGFGVFVTRVTFVTCKKCKVKKIIADSRKRRCRSNRKQDGVYRRDAARSALRSTAIYLHALSAHSLAQKIANALYRRDRRSGLSASKFLATSAELACRHCENFRSDDKRSASKSRITTGFITDYCL